MGMIDSFWLQGMQAGHKNTFDCIKAFSETDFTEDLKKFDVPTLIIHGDDDQIVPIGAAGICPAKLVKGATLKIYAGAPHGLHTRTKTSSTPTCWHSLKPEIALPAPLHSQPLSRVRGASITISNGIVFRGKVTLDH
ncbi:MAG: alpha/beta hydrolase [Desulfocapsaceae bacterium]|nr:alpha/beta hydrolase [Desulfocapsaceae bacterium]